MFYPEKEVIATWPSYDELVEQGCGAFLHDPSTADPNQVYEIYCERYEYKGPIAPKETEETAAEETVAEEPPTEETVDEETAAEETPAEETAAVVPSTEETVVEESIAKESTDAPEAAEAANAQPQEAAA